MQAKQHDETCPLQENLSNLVSRQQIVLYELCMSIGFPVFMQIAECLGNLTLQLSCAMLHISALATTFQSHSLQSETVAKICLSFKVMALLWQYQKSSAGG